ncbi:MAG: Na+/H+ antiporter NhaA [Bacteroidetes bacterium]|nr:Na+/H+ antiporter NhaA [Bacteroidota bacterium]MBS1649845.1 Na+/H+ antiporter NhaA [Bacteroidota bacterium]
MKIFRSIIIDPLIKFIKDSRAIGITLLCCTILSLIISNISELGEQYQQIWLYHFDRTDNHHTHLFFLSLPNSFLLIINDFLMAIFFFLAGMEIKRELLEGELSSFKKSILPIAAAIGGMIMPALFFLFFNHNNSFNRGWAIPTATDIAFTLGIASLLGKRVPVSLKIFLTALAIIDDLGAIVVIAIFYGGTIKIFFLIACAVIISFLFLLNKFKVKNILLHILLALALWYCMFNSGIHATVAGVVFALFIPVQQLKQLEHKFHFPVYFLIVPLFALANSSIQLANNSFNNIAHSPLSWGIAAGLCLGKPLGIFLISFLMIKLKWASMPNETNTLQLLGAGILAGIGFTMSIFIATLAFTTQAEQDIAKITVLIASLISMIIGFIWLRIFSSKKIH